MKKQFASIIVSLFPVGLLVLGSGCSTMKEPPLTTGSADSYTQHEQTNGMVVGIRPMTDKREIEDMFKVNLLDKGLLPILVVAENQSPAASFIIAKDKLFVLNEGTGTASSSRRKKVTGAASPRSASPIGPAPTLLPRMALPLLTDHPLKAIEL